MSYKKYVLHEIKHSDIQPASKEDINELKDALVWPPEFTRDKDLLRASQLQQEKKEILDNSHISASDKLKLIGEAEQKFQLFHSKAENIPTTPQVIAGRETFTTELDYPDYGKPIPPEEILQNLRFGKDRAIAALGIINNLMKAKGAIWNSRGELFNPNSKQIIPGSDIHKLIKYQLQPNKEQTTAPVGYVFFSEYQAALEGRKKHKKKRRQLRGKGKKNILNKINWEQIVELILS